MHQSNPKQDFRDALNFAQRQVRRLIEAHPGFYPLYTDHGRWKHDKPAWTRWCDGFLPGMMWLFLESTADDPSYWRNKAEEYSSHLEERKEDPDVHDLGFIFYHSTYKRWYEATVREGKPNQRLKDVVVRAGQVLAMRHMEKGRYLRSFISDESLFIDIMMNVPIIFYAYDEGDWAGEKGHLERLQLGFTALNHCYTTRRVLLRGDGSTAHEGIFDTSTGEFLRQTTHQGYRGDSCWSRGLAWSLYGFALCYEHAKDPPFLAAAEANAEYWLRHMAEDGVPPWDFDAPAEGKLSSSQPDSSAAAIAACGFFKLASLTHDLARAIAYTNTALRTLQTLCQPPYLAIDDKNWEGILKRGVYHIHKGLGVDESVMWGEFFFVEALTKALATIP